MEHAPGAKSLVYMGFYGCSFVYFLFYAFREINNAAKCFVSLKQNYSEGFICAPSIFLALKRDQI